jgi:hypothetical protein
VSADDRWRGWLVPGVALVIAAAVLIVAVVFAPGSTRPAASASPNAGGSPSASPEADEHTVVTADETLEFQQVGATIEVRRLAGASPGLIATLQAGLDVPPSGQTPAASTTSFFVILCGTDPNTARRYIVGHIDGKLPLTYLGPAAVGHGTTDGLFLYALNVGPIGFNDPIRIKTDDGLGLVGLGGGTFEQATTEGVKQPSGCWSMG